MRQLANERKLGVEKVKIGEKMMPLAEESDITIVYDPTRGWEYSMEKITGIDGDTPTTQAVLNRPLNGFKWPCAHIEDVIQEAFDSDAVNCVIRLL